MRRRSREVGTEARFTVSSAKLAAAAQHQNALLLYRLAYGTVPKKRVNPAVYRNLALVHKALDEPAKVRACFNMYLSRHPKARDADRIRAELALYPATPPVRCVSAVERQAAARRALRMGAKIQAWVAQAGR